MTQTLYTLPELPHKHDIIPIHASDISSFLTCRRRWDWTSPSRNNLTRKVQLYGVNPNLWFGTGIHYALERFYSPILRRDPVEVFSTWFAMQWEGGFIPVGEDEHLQLEQSYDLEPVALDNGWQVRGLRDLLPSPDEEEWLGYRELGIGMMEFYKDYAERNDDFEVIAAESNFSIPLGFTAVDIREESHNYGKKIEVHLRGKRDAILYYPDRKDPNKQYGIHDYKTKSIIDDNWKESLANDPQATTYIVASIKEAEQYGLPWTNIQDVLFTALRKVHPKPPTITTRGFPSLNRNDESCTAPMFMDTVVNMGLEDWYHNDLKAQGYYEYLLENGDKTFIEREPATRNPHQIKVAFDELVMVAKEMVDPMVNTYKHPSGSFTCTKCSFRAPCLAKDDGSDWKEMLVQGYELNRDR